jgi:hypothetical protein
VTEAENGHATVARHSGQRGEQRANFGIGVFVPPRPRLFINVTGTYSFRLRLSVGTPISVPLASPGLERRMICDKLAEAGSTGMARLRRLEVTNHSFLTSYGSVHSRSQSSPDVCLYSGFVKC